MEEWKEYKLEEVCSRLRSGKGIKSDCISNIGLFPVIGGNGMRGYTNKSNFKGECAVIGRQGANCGNVRFFMGEAYMTEHAVVAVGNELADSYFLARLLSLMHLGNLSAQSAQPGLSIQTLSKQIIRLPSISYQREISTILKSLDDKIELNRRINDNLEQQAQALFKSWFVDFEPFLREEFFKSDSLFGDIPVEWHIVAIKDLSVYITDYVANGSFASLRENVRLYDKPNYAHFIRNTDLKAESYKMYVDKHSYEFLSKSVLEGGEIIISNVGDVGSVFLCPKLEKPMTLGNNIILLRPKKDYLTFYLYMLFKGGIGQHLIDGVTGGSAQRKFNKTDFKSIKLMMPPVNILIKFDRIVKPIFSKIEENRDEISRLTSLRDTLLPKLMSGELKINEISN